MLPYGLSHGQPRQKDHPWQRLLYAYYYARESQRVNGKPKIVRQVYLGRADDIVAKLQHGHCLLSIRHCSTKG